MPRKRRRSKRRRAPSPARRRDSKAALARARRAAALKGWETRRRIEREREERRRALVRSRAAKEAWKKRRREEAKRSAAAEKGWLTRKRKRRREEKRREKIRERLVETRRAREEDRFTLAFDMKRTTVPEVIEELGNRAIVVPEAEPMLGFQVEAVALDGTRSVSRVDEVFVMDWSSPETARLFRQWLSGAVTPEIDGETIHAKIFRLLESVDADAHRESESFYRRSRYVYDATLGRYRMRRPQDTEKEREKREAAEEKLDQFEAVTLTVTIDWKERTE